MLRTLVALLSSLALSGCIIVANDPDDGDRGAGETGSADSGAQVACGDPDSFSFLDAAGNCVCEEGLVWCTDDVEDYSCCLPACGDPNTNSEETADGQCQCMDGFDWCTDDPDDVTCCEP